jgi:hypothetical protein
MLVPLEKLREWANLVDPTAQIYINQFLMEVDAKVKSEVDAAKKLLWDYGIKTSDD